MERSRIKKWYVCFNVIGVIISKLLEYSFSFVIRYQTITQELYLKFSWYSLQVEDEIDASIREVNQLLGELPTAIVQGTASSVTADNKALLNVETK